MKSGSASVSGELYDCVKAGLLKFCRCYFCPVLPQVLQLGAGTCVADLLHDHLLVAYGR